jgi:hypothetical protein
LNTVLLFECGANCCLDALKLPGALGEDIDKLPFLSKYEFFLSKIKPGAEFDRGCREVQAVAELKAIRDSYVHARVKKQKYSKVEDMSPDFGKTATLKIPRDPARWQSSHAVLALQAANDFFNLFFLSLCNLDPDTVSGILLGSEAASIPASSAIFVDGVGSLDRARDQWNIDFRFIGKPGRS